MGILHVMPVTRGALIPGIYDLYAGWPTPLEFVDGTSPPGAVTVALREPVGVVGAIIPWNARSWP